MKLIHEEINKCIEENLKNQLIASTKLRRYFSANTERFMNWERFIIDAIESIGNLYLDANYINSNEIYCGNALDVLQKFPDESVDLIVTSPPYDKLRTYNGYSFDFEGIAQQLTRVLKQGGVIVWVVADSTVKGSKSLTSHRQALYFMEKCGLKVHDIMIYEKNSSAFPAIRDGMCTIYWGYSRLIFPVPKGMI